MPQWLQNLFAGWPMIRANWPTFITLLVLMAVSIGGLMEWSYGGVVRNKDSIISNKDSEIAFLKSQRDDYKDKLSGASPAEAKARIDHLEARLAAIEPRRLTKEQRATLIAGLLIPIGDNPTITIATEPTADALQLVVESSVFGVGARPRSGIQIAVPDADNLPPAAVAVQRAFASANIPYDLVRERPQPGVSVSLLISPRINR